MLVYFVIFIINCFALFKVQDIVDEKREGKVTLYRVRWKGYKAKDDSWLPKQDLGCPKIFKKYLKIRNKDNEDTFTVIITIQRSNQLN